MKENELSHCISQSLDIYFHALEGEPPRAVYDMVLKCVEKPLLSYILNYVQGNQSKAAEILGINRNTLRKKLKQYHLQ